MDDRRRRSTRPWSWKIGEFFGIGIHVHATFLVLVGWIVVSDLAAGRNPRESMDGVVLLLSVFALVVLHELGHALMALRFGIRTRDITLLPIGGVARLERMPEKPAQELLVALAGPSVNVALALLLVLAMKIAGQTIGPPDLGFAGSSFAAKLLWINASLAAFNLLPAFPMDGGRVLRAALALRMEYVRATDTAARLGQALAFLLGALGVLANPILILIAVFVWFGAAQEAAVVRIRSALRGIPVRSAMITDFATLSPKDRLSRAVELAVVGFQHDFPVVEGDLPVGLLSQDAIVKGLARNGPDLRVGSAMNERFDSVDPGDMLESALVRLRAPMVVLEKGRVVGVLTADHIGEFATMRGAMRDAPAIASLGCEDRSFGGGSSPRTRTA